jgi:glucosamine 6-phosphate synthetase-like amidotransferase/phosphosugar isomerase protein
LESALLIEQITHVYGMQKLFVSGSFNFQFIEENIKAKEISYIHAEGYPAARNETQAIA